MACEYFNIKDNKCELTARLCTLDFDLDKVAYRHCMRREWKNKLVDRRSYLLQRPCSALPDIITPKCPRLPL